MNDEWRTSERIEHSAFIVPRSSLTFAGPGPERASSVGLSFSTRNAYTNVMSPMGKRLLKDALQLSQEERAALAGELLDSLDPTSPSQRRSEQEWLAEVRRRAEAALAGKSGLTWDETIKQVTDRLAQQ